MPITTCEWAAMKWTATDELIRDAIGINQTGKTLPDAGTWGWEVEAKTFPLVHGGNFAFVYLIQVSDYAKL